MRIDIPWCYFPSFSPDLILHEGGQREEWVEVDDIGRLRRYLPSFALYIHERLRCSPAFFSGVRVFQPQGQTTRSGGVKQKNKPWGDLKGTQFHFFFLKEEEKDGEKPWAFSFILLTVVDGGVVFVFFLKKKERKKKKGIDLACVVVVLWICMRDRT